MVLFPLSVSLRCVHVECVKRDTSEPGSQPQDGYTCGVCKQLEQDSTEHAVIHTVQDAVLADPEAAEGEFQKPRQLRKCKEARNNVQLLK